MASDVRPLDPDAFARLFADATLDLPPGARLLVAVSGGPDSVCLMGALARWSRESGRCRVAVATVDHGLRAGAADEAAGVARQAAVLGLPHATLRWVDRPAGAVSQAAAREARYRLLSAHAASLGAGCLLTAHTQDDQAETLLMRMAAGSGIAGLAGMAARVRRDGVLHLRPFLSLAKAALVATCERESWSFVEDPSNGEPRFARTRWRARLPDLARDGLDAARLARLAARAARAEAALAVVAEVASRRIVSRQGDAILIDARRLCAEPEEIALRVLGDALTGGDDRAAPRRLERLEACLAAIAGAVAAGRALRRTLAGRVVTLSKESTIAIVPEPPRRRGRAGTVPAERSPRSPKDAATNRPGA